MVKKDLKLMYAQIKIITGKEAKKVKLENAHLDTVGGC